MPNFSTRIKYNALHRADHIKPADDGSAWPVDGLRYPHRSGDLSVIFLDYIEVETDRGLLSGSLPRWCVVEEGGSKPLETFLVFAPSDYDRERQEWCMPADGPCLYTVAMLAAMQCADEIARDNESCYIVPQGFDEAAAAGKNERFDISDVAEVARNHVDSRMKIN